MKFLNSLVNNLFLFDVKHSSEAKVKEAEKLSEIKFPTILFEFFLLVGDDYNDLFDGVGTCSLNRLGYNISLAKKLLNERDLHLDHTFLPFASHGGDQFMFVYLDGGENPPVYRFETELFYCRDNYIPGSSSWGYPKGVSKVAANFDDMINQIVNERLSLR